VVTAPYSGVGCSAAPATSKPSSDAWGRLVSGAGRGAVSNAAAAFLKGVSSAACARSPRLAPPSAASSSSPSFAPGSPLHLDAATVKLETARQVAPTSFLHSCSPFPPPPLCISHTSSLYFFQCCVRSVFGASLSFSRPCPRETRGSPSSRALVAPRLVPMGVAPNQTVG
jgi:hypothetical protein